jgi:flagellar hook protein FlgE
MTAVTGVRAHQTMLDVTGNNIANINTTGFKKDFTIFQDLLYQTTQGATGPGDTRGGSNPAQVGLGVKVGAIETIHSQGFAQYTGNKSDMMISGEGYFVLRDGTSRIYSRAGNFTLDAKNNLVHSGTGYNVQGYAMTRDPLNPQQFVKAGDISDINIPIGRKMEARGTTVVGYKCNLDSRADPYLPIGYADIPYTPYMSAHPAKVKIDGTDYDMTFKTNYSTDGKGYLTVTFDNGSGITPLPSIVFDMVDVRNGLPDLTTTTTTVNLGTAAAPKNATVSYDHLTGQLKLLSTDPAKLGATLWETNLNENMSYTSFTLEDKIATPPTSYNFIAEFDESALSGSPTTLTLWYKDPGGTGMSRLQATVSFKSDGTFDTVSPLTGTGPGSFNVAGSLKVEASEDGATLNIQAAKTPATPATSTFDTIAQISQGGVHQTKMTVYDCQGFPYTLETQFKKLTANTWRWEAFFVDGEGNTMTTLMPTPSSGVLTFDDSCLLVGPDSVDINVPFSLLGRENSTIKLDFSGKSFGQDKLEGVTQFASESTTKGYYQDGYAMGVLNDYTVSKDGTIVGVYTNGQNQPIYRVALAQFANPMGLEKIGDTMIRESVNTGLARIDAAMADGAGSIVGSTLEMSNVDLTEEFTRLIISQRGFQANTRVVTTSDQILEEVVNLKR